jgi:hypothetical protein
VLAALAVPSTAAAARPDLVVTRVADPPATAAPGQSVAVSATVRNRGRGRAKPSALRFLLSLDSRRSADDPRLGDGSVRALKRGKRRQGVATVTIPAVAGGSSWRLIACADGAGAVKEKREGNNCRAAATPIAVTAPPPAPAPPPGPGPAPGPGPSPGPPPAETCNGADDDGDGQADDGVCLVTVTLAGAGSGTVTSTPAGISCPGTCAAAFPAGGTVTLTATPATGSVFRGWAGACSADPCAVTPGEPQVTATFAPAPPQVGQLVINEIHADPDPGQGDVNGDGVVSATGDEFVEIVNRAAHAVDLGGVTVLDSAMPRHVFADGSALAAGCAAVVFGSGASTGRLALNDDGDTVTVTDAAGAVTLTTVTYGPEGGFNDSLTRSPDLALTPLQRHTDVSSQIFSPGTKLNGAAFC